MRNLQTAAQVDAREVGEPMKIISHTAGDQGCFDLAQSLKLKRELIVEAWTERVLADPVIPQANRLSVPLLVDHVPDFLDTLVASLKVQDSSNSHEELGRRVGAGQASKQHARLRLLAGYSLPEALRELSHLRSVIIEHCYAELCQPQGASLLHAAIDRAMAEVADEISLQQLAEQRAHAITRELLHLMIEGVADRAIFVATPNGRIVSWNLGVARLLGYQEDEWLGRPISMIFTPEDKVRRTAEYEFENAKSKGRDTNECQHVRKDGSRFWAENFTAPLTGESGELRGFTIIISDRSEQKANAEKLEKSRTHLQLTQTAARVASWDWDFASGQVNWSENAEAVFGARPPDTFEAFQSLIVPEDLEIVASQAQHAIANRSSYEAEFRIRWPDGRISWIMGRGQAIYDQQGQAVRLLGVNLEITEKKLVEMERDRFFALSADPLCILDKNGYFKRINPAWEDRLGYREEEVLGRNWVDLVHPEDQAETRAFISKTLNDEDPGSLENRILHKEGGYRWFLWSARSYSIDATLYASARDITDRRQAENQFRSLANSIPQLAWMADSKGSIYWYNQRWYDYTGTSLEEVKGWGWRKLHHPDHLERVVRSIQHSWDSGEPWEETFPLRSHQGDWRWFLSRAVPIKDDHGQVILWFGTNTDITQEKKMSEELQQAKNVAEDANRTKTAFLANVSHELRTPLGAILGFAELLKDPLLRKEEREEFIETIIRNGKQLSELIGEVLDLGKIEAGKVDIERIKIDLQRFIHETADSLAVKAREKDIELELAWGEDLPQQIESDPLRLRQILFNIIGNSIKFTDRGFVQVKVEKMSLQGSKPQKISISVRDSGRGIPYDAQDLIFQPFTQADSSTTRKYGGTGLGLAISRKLARLLGGDVVLKESEPGQGSLFVITFEAFPVSRVAPLQLTESSEKQAQSKGASRLAGIQVLLAEDSADNQLLVKRMLQKEGAKVEIAGNGRDAVQRALSGHYDVVLMDIQMPLMDGYDATRELRRQGYRGAIVALTAHAMSDERMKSIEAGCDDHLTKPLSTPRLLSTVEKHLLKN